MLHIIKVAKATKMIWVELEARFENMRNLYENLFGIFGG
jgi:hypothetical protein